MSAIDFEFPDISLSDIERKAEQLIEAYEDNMGKRVRAPIPVESIAEHHLGYDIDITNEGLFANPNYLGGIVFDENIIRVNASVEGHEGRYNFTIAHEIGHHVLHRDHYLAHRDASDPGIMCREASAKPLVERQADQFASALLMPADLVRKAIESLPGVATGEISVKALRVLASQVVKAGQFSNVSNTAMCNRLITLGYARGMDYQTGKSIDLLRSSEARGYSAIDRWFYKKLKRAFSFFR